jgi:hypothetical protein
MGKIARIRSLRSILPLAIFLLMLACNPLHPQTRRAAISGTVTDSTGALIPGATVTLQATDGVQKIVVSDALGRYSFAELAAGKYVLSASAERFALASGLEVEAGPGCIVNRDIQLEIAVLQENVEVTENSIIDTDPSNNASMMTLSGNALQTLSDDPDDLAQDIQMLAGPSAGPEGGEVFVDGFSGAKLPAKSSIRDIRVNQNPFSAEFDRLGYGRVEILTKPGADQLHGEVRFNLNDSLFNARNPFATEKPDYQRRTFEGGFGGPIRRNTSFLFQLERRDIGQAALVNAMILNENFSPVPFRTSILDPRMNTEISGRIDHQLGANHTLIGRYEWEKDGQTNAGLDTYSMPSRAYATDEREQTVQVTETAVINARAVNEVKFQYRRSEDSNRAVSSDPAVQVPEAFIDGGTSASLNHLLENRYELQEVLSLAAGKHTFKLGGRFRAIDESNASADDYNGIYTFASLDAYSITEEGLRNHLTPSQIRALGGGASQFSMSVGDPLAAVTQFDLGVFAQNDWRLRPNLTLSAGLRFEAQTNIDRWQSWAPRLGMAWSIPGPIPDNPLAVLRIGYGEFYDRVRENLVIDARRLDGIHQQTYLVPDPDFYPRIPSADTVSQYVQDDDVVRKLARSLRAPDTSQFTASLERQFPRNTKVSLSYLNSRGSNMLRSRNINAPLPSTGLRPLPGGNLYVYESSGRFRQQQLIANVNARISRRYTIFGNYAWSKAFSDTDGAWSFPAQPFDVSAEYGRAGFDTRHRAMIGGSMSGPFALLFNPFVVMHTGGPFDITIGQDLNGDSIFNDRPAWVTDPVRTSVVRTQWGKFDTAPVPGQTIIPRNLGTSPGMVGFNLRVSRAFGFGPHMEDGNEMGPSDQHGAGGSGVGGGPMGHYHGSEAVAEDRKYSLTLTVAARNVLNTVNLDTPVGNLSSPSFGTSTSTHGFGSGSASANRTIEIQARFAF